MRYTLFIADLHLTESRPDITACFYSFLEEHVTSNCDALYILGDFFEVWIGDDEQSALQQTIANKLNYISSNICPVFFIHGNRDFLLGKKYATQCGMTLLPEEQLINLYGEQALIMHGDQLCTQDIKYQKFRKQSRSKWWQCIMLNLPLFLRKRIARNARMKSKESQQGVDLNLLDVVQHDVEVVMDKYDVNLLIHGHTHRPATHNFTAYKNSKTRIVLGDWYTQGSYLVVSEQEKHLVYKPFNRPDTYPN